MHELLGYIFAFISSICFSIYIIPKKIAKENNWYYMFYMSIGFVIVSLFSFFLIGDRESLFVWPALLTIVRGFLWVIATYLFLNSIDKIGISRSTQYKNLKGPIGVLLILICLQEFQVTNFVYVIISAILIFISAIIFTIKKDNVKINYKGVVMALMSSVILGLTALIQKYVTNLGYVYMQQFWHSITVFVSVAIIVLIKDRGYKSLWNVTLRNKLLAATGGILYYFATFFNVNSYKYLPASIAFIVINLSTIWSVILGITLFKEIDFKKNWKRIILGFMVALLGITTLFLAKK